MAEPAARAGRCRARRRNIEEPMRGTAIERNGGAIDLRGWSARSAVGPATPRTDRDGKARRSCTCAAGVRSGKSWSSMALSNSTFRSTWCLSCPLPSLHVTVLRVNAMSGDLEQSHKDSKSRESSPPSRVLLTRAEARERRPWRASGGLARERQRVATGSAKSTRGAGGRVETQRGTVAEWWRTPKWLRDHEGRSRNRRQQS